MKSRNNETDISVYKDISIYPLIHFFRFKSHIALKIIFFVSIIFLYFNQAKTMGSLMGILGLFALLLGGIIGFIFFLLPLLCTFIFPIIFNTIKFVSSILLNGLSIAIDTLQSGLVEELIED